MIRKLGLAVAIALFCSQLYAENKKNKSPFLGDVSGFKRSKDRKTLLISRHPSKKAIDYKKLMFEPVVILQSSHSVYAKPTRAEQAKLSELLRSMAVKEFEGVATIVDKPGEGVLDVRFAIRGLKRGRYHMTATGTQTITPDTKMAAATLEAEAIDSVSKERIIALVDEISPKQMADKEREDIIPTITDIFQDWVHMLKQTFHEQQNLSLIP